jgi:hypothetical protein
MSLGLTRIALTALVCASCGTSEPTTSGPSAALTAPPAVPPVTATPGATAAPPSGSSPAGSPSAASSQLPATSGTWVIEERMDLGRAAPRAVAISGGDVGPWVLVVGNDGAGCVRPDAGSTEVYTGNGNQIATLEPALERFAMVPLADGRALVTGGVTRGTPAGRSSAKTYIFRPFLAGSDPAAPPTWTPVASMSVPRTYPFAARLQDGRVLVAGGYDLSAGTVVGASAAPSIALAAYPPRVILADGPAYMEIAPALATAEIYDPATDTWSATGPLHYASFGSTAVTLADGRVLVVGPSPYDELDFYQIVTSGEGGGVEIYDPQSGRFSLSSSIPALDPASLIPPDLPVTSEEVTNLGTLLPLDDGGALLVGMTTSWESVTSTDEWDGTVIRTLRMDPRTGDWTEIDRRTVGQAGGHVNEGALAARLADGRVLVAGGWLAGEEVASDEAWLYDPRATTWTALPPMPVHRAEGVAVDIVEYPGDESVLLVGGLSEHRGPVCPAGATGIATVVRFSPAAVP